MGARCGVRNRNVVFIGNCMLRLNSKVREGAAKAGEEVYKTFRSLALTVVFPPRFYQGLLKRHLIRLLSLTIYIRYGKYM